MNYVDMILLLEQQVGAEVLGYASRQISFIDLERSVHKVETNTINSLETDLNVLI